MRVLLLSLLLLAAPFPAAAVEAQGPSVSATYAELLALAGHDLVQAPLREDVTLREAILDLYDLVGAVPTARGLATLDADLARLPAEVEAPSARLLAAMNDAARLRHEAFARVSVDDARFARDATLRGAPLTTEETERLEAVFARIDFGKMATAGDMVLRATALARTQLQGAHLAVGFVDPLGAVQIAGSGNDVHEVDRTLLIDLGGDDVHSNNAGATMPDFIIQAFPGCITTGGPDCTPLHPSRNELALESVFGRPCSFDATAAPYVTMAYATDADRHLAEQQAQPSLPALQRFLTSPSGATMTRANELSSSPQPDTRCLPQGAGDAEGWASDFVTRGILTDGDEHVVAVALDLGGNDIYAPPREFNDINDGDNAAGCDTRWMGEEGKLWARNLTAGSSFAGVGVLWDTAGSDLYGGRSLTQGVGHVGGVGILVDEGRGHDVYSGVRLAQGAAIFASVGLLYDEGGHDRYALENDVAFFNEFEHFIGCDASTRDGQGRANFNGVAGLVDLAGNDVYFVQQHAPHVPGASRDDPTTTQGSTGTRLNIGPHPVNGAAALGAALLYDGAGQDSYTRPGRADGTSDATGAFIDAA